AGSFVLTAGHDTDSSDVIEVEMPSNGFLRRNLYVGQSRLADSIPARGSAPPRRTRHGDGRLSGTVVAVVDGRPLSGAVVGIVDGPQTRANERGEWTLMGAPV